MNEKEVSDSEESEEIAMKIKELFELERMPLVYAYAFDHFYRAHGERK